VRGKTSQKLPLTLILSPRGEEKQGTSVSNLPELLISPVRKKLTGQRCTKGAIGGIE